MPEIFRLGSLAEYGYKRNRVLFYFVACVYRVVGFDMSTLFQAVIASGFHLFPFRTEQLSPYAPMVLRKWESRSPPFIRVERISRGIGPLLMRSLFLSGVA